MRRTRLKKGLSRKKKPTAARVLFPRQTRTSAQARRFVSLLRQKVDALLPRNSKVLVISKGDENLIKFDVCSGAHFPQESSGDHARFYPASSKAATGHLEALRFQGAQYLVVPATAHWWSEAYPEFLRYLERRYAVIDKTPEIGTIFALRTPSSWLELDELISDFRINAGRAPAILNWGCDLQFSQIFPECRWFQPPPTNSNVLPYLDQTIDFVAMSRVDSMRLSEARRVASEALILVANSGPLGSAPSLCVRHVSRNRAREATAVSIILGQSRHDFPVARKLAFLRESIPNRLRCEIWIREGDNRAGNHSHKTGRKSRERVPTRGIPVISELQDASGDIVIFIGARIVPLTGWLPPLLRLFSDRPDAGVVGGRLINFNGTQNQIGGTIFRDGSAALLGDDEIDPASPAYGHVRQLDFCATTFLATRRSLLPVLNKFPTFGGRDLYATAEYCLAVREQGYRVYFEPDCWAIDFDPSQDFSANGQFMKKRVAEFRANFGHVLRRCPSPQNGSGSFRVSQIA